jgi:SAM-dependent methyltransferase
MVLGLGSRDDHNYENACGFGGYEALRGLEFRSAIELGCGPFTNLRIIGDVSRVGTCDLLDPLIESYLTHPGCRYTANRLRVDRTRMAQATRSRLRQRLCLDGLTVSGTIPVGRLIAGPIEEMPLDRTYDLVVMENVVEHCYDVEAVLSNILSILSDRGILVIHDRYYDSDQVRDRVNRIYDAAHPLRVDRRQVEAFMADEFEPLFTRTSTVAAEFRGVDVTAETYYFIGRRVR